MYIGGIEQFLACQPSLHRPKDGGKSVSVWNNIKKTLFAAEKTYRVLSADGSRILEATDEKSCFSTKEYGGYTIQFPDVWATKASNASRWTFSGSPGKYRLHSGAHHNHMTYFVGPDQPQEWVVWDSPVPVTGSWEIFDVVWKDDDTFKLRHKEKWVRWAVACFVSTTDEAKATEFILCEA